MRRALIIFTIITSIGLTLLAVGLSSNSRMSDRAMVASQLSLTSPAFTFNGTIPCKSTNISPPLTIAMRPATTKSFVLIVHDLDAPDGDFSHWLVWNIAPDTTTIAANSLPPGATQGRNDFGTTGYRGPCPPSGQHRYAFDIYALDSQLKLKPTSSLAEVRSALTKHLLGQARLLGLYNKSM
jgi:Raf kinase inhibitor-like YbhB/YbcL family protein